jgi:hypothetical protein
MEADKRKRAVPARTAPDVKTEDSKISDNSGAVKIGELAHGHRWYFRRGSVSAEAYIDPEGGWHVEWSPRMPRWNRKKGKAIFAAYVQWRDAVAQQLADSSRMSIGIQDNASGVIFIKQFTPEQARL